MARRLQTLDACVTEPLVARGPAAAAVDGAISQIASLPLLQVEDGAAIGIWESTPGRWPRALVSAEFCVILAGRGRFEQEGAEAIELEPGALIFFPESTMGVWVIETTVRKVYVLL